MDFSLPLWIALPLLLLFLSAGMGLGVLLQRSHWPGRTLQRLLATEASLRTGLRRTDEEPIALEVRSFRQTSSWEPTPSERELHPDRHTIQIAPSETALVLIDVWEYHPNQNWLERANWNISNKLLPLLQSAREQGIPVIHCPNGRGIHPLIRPLPQEMVIEGAGQETRFVNTLHQLGIKHLLYSGYASNMCVLTRPTGIIKMHDRGFNIIFVRDASLALETPEFVDDELTHQVVTYMIETNWGVTTEVDSIISALARRSYQT